MSSSDAVRKMEHILYISKYYKHILWEKFTQKIIMDYINILFFCVHCHYENNIPCLTVCLTLLQWYTNVTVLFIFLLQWDSCKVVNKEYKVITTDVCGYINLLVRK